MEEGNEEWLRILHWGPVPCDLLGWTKYEGFVPQEAEHPCFPQLQTAPANTWEKLAGEQSHFSVSDSPLHFDCICCSKILFGVYLHKEKMQIFTRSGKRQQKMTQFPFLLWEKNKPQSQPCHVFVSSQNPRSPRRPSWGSECFLVDNPISIHCYLIWKLAG